MDDQYLIINKKILPDYYQSVIDARNLLNQGVVKSVSEATQRVGISRSTYYKFKDYIFSPSDNGQGKKAVVSMMLNHEKGVLSEVLNLLAGFRANILTINQSIPINGQASVTISLDISDARSTMEEMIHECLQVRGVQLAKLIALE